MTGLTEQLAPHIRSSESMQDALALRRGAFKCEEHELPPLAHGLEGVEASLLDRWPVIDMVEVLKVPHPKMYQGVRPPRFALYHVDEEGLVQIGVGTPVGDWDLKGWRSNDGQAGLWTGIIVRNGRLVTGRASQSRFQFPDWYPQAVTEHYNREQGRVLRIKNTLIMLGARFSGVIPQEARQKIAEAKETFAGAGEGVGLVQEVPEWDAQVHHNPDPLIVGWRNGVYYLVGEFLTTTAEGYLKREFVC